MSTFRNILTAFVFLIFAACSHTPAYAQTTTSATPMAADPTAPTVQPPAPPVATNANGSFQPAYYVGAGTAYDYYGHTGFGAETQVAIRIGSTNAYSCTAMELGQIQATIRTGACYIMYQAGNWTIAALADLGLTTGSGLTLGSFSGGLLTLWDVGAKVTKGASHAYLGFGMKMIQTASLGAQPVPLITFGKGL